MSPRTRKLLVIATPLVVVVVIALAFYNFNSAIKTSAVLNSTFRQSTPLVLAALCGLLGERTGIVNIGIEGQLLMSAFTGFYTAAATGSIWTGVLAGVLSGALLGVFLALCAVNVEDRPDHRRHGDQHLRRRHHVVPLHPGQDEPRRPRRDSHSRLSDLPLVGEVLFTNTPIAWLAIIFVFVLHVGLFHTRWGLRSRSVGEHPSAADTVGISVGGFRYLNTALAGGLAGFGGAFLSLEAVGTFERGMSANRGFTALAIMIFGRWKPFLAWYGALFFAFTTAMAAQLQFDQVIDVPAAVHQHPALRPRHPRPRRDRRQGPPARRRRPAVREGVSAHDRRRPCSDRGTDGARGAPPDEALPVGRSPTTTSASSSAGARSSACSARTAPARARSSRCSSGSTTPTRARS